LKITALAATPTERIELLAKRLRGDKPPPLPPRRRGDSDARCAAMAYNDAHGKLDVPRQCRQRARDGSQYCGTHERLAERACVIFSNGGWCVWCGTEGRRYTCSRDPRTTIALCDECARAMVRAVPR